MTYTPGPWRIRQDGNFGNTIEAVAGIQYDGKPRYAHVASFQAALPRENRDYRVKDANALANGNLIAAAPELFEACVEIDHGALMQPDGTYTITAGDLKRVIDAVRHARGIYP